MKISFIVDGMLGSIASKLRIFGFDTEYNTQLIDKEILEIAKNKGRIIITSDKFLSQIAAKQKIEFILINEKDDKSRLITIFRKKKLKGDSIKGYPSRCPKCNEILSFIDKDHLKNSIPEKILSSGKEFFKCRICGKVYWEGSHWIRINELLKEVDAELKLY